MYQFQFIQKDPYPQTLTHQKIDNNIILIVYVTMAHILFKLNWCLGQHKGLALTDANHQPSQPESDAQDPHQLQHIVL